MASDQTPESYQAFALLNQMGTGVFLRVGASGETMISFEQNLTYQDCVALGQDYRAFKWIPAQVSSFEAVVGSRCRLAGEPCSDSCDADGCLCNSDRGQCVDASGNSQLLSGSGGLSSGGWGEEPAIAEISGVYSRR